MGQLAIGLGGAVVGSFFGVPSLGFAVGTFIGGQIFGTERELPAIEGPRLQDLRVSSSTHGRPIPEGFGVIRLPGNLIWSTGIQEARTVTEVGGGSVGKGGAGSTPSQEQVSYSYSVSCSFAFAQGPAEDILRIWADGKVIYDIRDPATTSAPLTPVIKPGLNMRKYLGTETQDKCPLMVSIEGDAETPAHRGTVYVTFENFDLTDFGNRIPQITAEVAFKAAGVDSGRQSTDAGILFNRQSDIYVDWRRNLAYSFATAGADSTDGLRAWDISTMTEVRTQRLSDMGSINTGWSANDFFLVSPYTGRIYAANVANSTEIEIIDPDSLTVIGSVGTHDAGGDFNHGVYSDDPAQPDIAGPENNGVEATCFAPDSGDGLQPLRIFLLVHGQVTDGPYVLDVSNPQLTKGVVWENSPPITQSIRGVPEPAQIGQAIIWFLYGGTGNATRSLYKWTINFNARLENVAPSEFRFEGVRRDFATSFSSSLWLSSAGSGSTDMLGPVYDQTDGNLMFAINMTSDRIAVWKWNKTLNQIQWNLIIDDMSIADAVSLKGATWSNVKNGRWGLTGGNGLGSGRLVVIDTIAGEVIHQDTDVNSTFSEWWNLDNWVWDDTTQCFTSIAQGTGTDPDLEQFCVGRAVGLGEPLDEVVALLSSPQPNGAGLAASQYNVTQLASDLVRGYAVTSKMSVAHALGPLFTAYDFDAAEVDDKVVFSKRNSTPVATITQQDIVDAETLVRETRTQEVELPEKIDLNYIDQEIDYQENLAQAKRHAAPVPTMYSRNDETLNLAIVFLSTEATVIVERLLFTAWSQRKRLSFSLSREFIKLVPTSVVTLTLDSGTSFLLRIVKEQIGDLVQSYEAVVQESTLQVSSNPLGTGGGGNPNETIGDNDGFEEPTLPASFNTRLFMIDSPYLRDIDQVDRQSIELKFGMAGYISGWQSGVLWDSDDSFSYNPAQRVSSPVTYGIMTTTLGPYPGNITDTTNTFRVRMVEGSLSSVTDAQFLANEQVGIIGSPVTQRWEFVAFRDAVLDADGNYTCSTLMRGRRGTDAPEITENHAGGEIFILARRDSIERLLLPLSKLNATRYYRGVGRNEFLEVAETVSLASTGGPLKPFRPYHLTAVVDGSNNIDFTWKRSNRILFELTNSASWQNGALSEDSESYEVDILDQPGGSVVRTIAVSAEAAEYTKAQLITDLAVSNGTATIDVGSSSTFTQGAGSFVTDGFVAGMKIETSGFTDGANNGVFTISNVAALTLTIEETSLVTESGTGDEVINAIREDDITFKVYQKSAQAGRGFASEEATISL